MAICHGLQAVKCWQTGTRHNCDCKLINFIAFYCNTTNVDDKRWHAGDCHENVLRMPNDSVSRTTTREHDQHGRCRSYGRCLARRLNRHLHPPRLQAPSQAQIQTPRRCLSIQSSAVFKIAFVITTPCLWPSLSQQTSINSHVHPNLQICFTDVHLNMTSFELQKAGVFIMNWWWNGRLDWQVSQFRRLFSIL